MLNANWMSEIDATHLLKKRRDTMTRFVPFNWRFISDVTLFFFSEHNTYVSVWLVLLRKLALRKHTSNFTTRKLDLAKWQKDFLPCCIHLASFQHYAYMWHTPHGDFSSLVLFNFIKVSLGQSEIGFPTFVALFLSQPLSLSLPPFSSLSTSFLRVRSTSYMSKVDGWHTNLICFPSGIAFGEWKNVSGEIGFTNDGFDPIHGWDLLTWALQKAMSKLKNGHLEIGII